jgi:predicted nucleic acid-binding protein
MADRPTVFLDTSALFSGIWSEQGGARLILTLAEVGAIRLLTCSQVLEEIESAIRRKAPDLLGLLAFVLDRCDLEIAPDGSRKLRKTCLVLAGHAADARILAAAWHAQYLVTLDRKHILSSRKLRKATPFRIATPGEFIDWYREHVMTPEADTGR